MPTVLTVGVEFSRASWLVQVWLRELSRASWRVHVWPCVQLGSRKFGCAISAIRLAIVFEDPIAALSEKGLPAGAPQDFERLGGA